MIAPRSRTRPRLLLALAVLLAAACTPETEPAETPEPDEVTDIEEAPPAEEDEEPEAAPDPSEHDDLVVGAGDPDLLAELGAIAAEVAELRQLEILEPIQLDIVTAQDLVGINRELLDEAAEDEERQARRDQRQRALEALHLLPEGVDLDAASEAMIEVAVLGVFIPDREQAYAVAEEGELSPAVRATVAHELLHAIQHQHLDLSRAEDLHEPDERFAFTAVVEGDAVLIEEDWVDDHLDAEERQEREQELGRLGVEAQGVLDELPPYLLLKQLLPYELGVAFVDELRETEGDEAVDDALRDPPATSVELYDLELYLDGFEPEEPRPLNDPGEEWSSFHTSRFGAWQVDMFSYSLSMPLSPLGASWRGGHLEAWERDEEVAGAFSVTFEEDGAVSFCERLPGWFELHAGATEVDDATWELERGTLRIGCDGPDLQLAVGPDRATADAILDLQTRELPEEE